MSVEKRDAYHPFHLIGCRSHNGLVQKGDEILSIWKKFEKIYNKMLVKNLKEAKKRKE
jgi:hypothetical protein